ncbi:MAG: heparinase II/III family protein [Butyrivibrio sp.]|uniref:heparinase II/III domain-containing protein n=1 Tax=Butyrivibrio sp. TaxID=28121 RepID=UPI001B59A8E9|nr:heparinase II/III family protein [Butyrivibrio sp.]MBP3784912.1 heparinase II/III family protein [Butyrivibrio sp.]
MGRTIVSDHVKETKGAGIFSLYPNISNRESWEGLPSQLKKEITEAGQEAQKTPWTQLLISDFTEFSKSGNRLAFEDKYFPRRRKLSALVMAECVENKGRFLDDILDGLYLILEETTWCLPAHNSYIRDTKQEYLPDENRPIIDLFDAETGAFVAMAEYLLRPQFEKISPYICSYVDKRLNDRIFKPYFAEHFWWMGNGKEPMCNWTPWITQNVLLSALTRKEDFFTEDERRKFIEKAAVSLDYFLDEYGDDGCCNEGAQYYSHAGLCLFGALEIMRNALDDGYGEKKNHFADVFKEPLISNIGSYIVKMHAAGDYYINFADCSPICGRRTAREYLYGKATGDEALMSFAALDFAKASLSERLLSDEINLFYHVMQAFSCAEILSFKGKETAPTDCFFESTGLMIARDERFVLAAKAGNNADSHNHNDVGSFTVYKDGRPLIIDLGVETYRAKTFSDKRYEIWTMQSQFHNLPTFLEEGYDGTLGADSAADLYDSRIVMEKDGIKFKAADVSCVLNRKPERDGTSQEAVSFDTASLTEGVTVASTLKMDIAHAYGDDRIKSYVREISLIKGEGIMVKDSYDGDLDAVLSIMTYEKPEIFKNDSLGSSLSLKMGEAGILDIHGAELAGLEPIEITDPRLSIAWKHEVYRILVRIKKEILMTLI